MVELYEVIETESEVCFVTQLMTGRDLVSFLATRSEHSEGYVRHVVKAVLSALARLHSKKIIHKDISVTPIFEFWLLEMVAGSSSTS